MRASPLFRNYLGAASEAIAETFWPTRCAACGALGEVLCENCKKSLPYIDQWKACPVCGAPWGRHQCTECNSFSLESLGYKHVSFHQCVSSVMFNEQSARIIRMRKDSGERRLAQPMALAIACAIPPHWVASNMYVSFIPSTKQALQRRGFCHAHELAEAVAHYLHLPCKTLLSSRSNADQRLLSRTQRALNTRESFSAQPCKKNEGILLVDDVYTTGATALAASDAFKIAGYTTIYVATFARVM